MWNNVMDSKLMEYVIMPTMILLLILSIPFGIMGLSFAASWFDGLTQMPTKTISVQVR